MPAIGRNVPSQWPTPEEQAAQHVNWSDITDPARQMFGAYQDWSERHPVLSFAGEMGASALAHGVAKRVPGLGRLVDIYDAAMRAGHAGGWGEGAQIAPEYRHPAKRRLNEEIDQIKNSDDYRRWWNDPSSTHNQTLETLQSIVDHRLAEVNGGNTGESGPYEIDMFRAPQGYVRPARPAGFDPTNPLSRAVSQTPAEASYVGDPKAWRGPVPGRGEHYSAQPPFAAKFDPSRGPNMRGKEFNTMAEEIQAMRGLNAQTLRFERPLIIPQDVQKIQDFMVGQRVPISEVQANQYEKIYNGIYNAAAATEGRPLEQMTPKELAATERWMMQEEKFWVKIAKQHGFDAIIRAGDIGAPEIIAVDPKIKQSVFSMEPGTPRQRPPQTPLQKPSYRSMPDIQTLLDALTK